MAAYAEGKKWHVIGDGELRSKFLGPSIQLRPVGIMQLTFHDGDDYTWHKVCFETAKRSWLNGSHTATYDPFLTAIFVTQLVGGGM